MAQLASVHLYYLSGGGPILPAGGVPALPQRHYMALFLVERARRGGVEDVQPPLHLMKFRRPKQPPDALISAAVQQQNLPGLRQPLQGVRLSNI